MSAGVQIPDKLYFKIGEVARLVGVEPYVLRYWESEFPQITPVKSQAKQRLYKREDVELIAAIKELLYDQKFTIDGARKRLTQAKGSRKDITRQQQIALDLEAGEFGSLGQDPVSPRVENSDSVKNEIKLLVAEMDEFLAS